MAYYVYKGDEERQMKFVVDTEADIANLPNLADNDPGTQDVMAGSAAFCIGNSSLYMLNSEGVWKKVGG